MRADLVISYRHDAATGAPVFAGNEVAECVARDVRQQLTGSDDSVLAIGLERLTKIRTVCVNNISYALEWSTDAAVTDDQGKPVLGICEFDPDGLPDAALICVNPEPVGSREAVMLSTGGHEMGHGLFEAPAWIYAHQRASVPGLFDFGEPARPRRVLRTTTPNESHFCATYPPGSKEFFQEARANEFMGSLLAPRRLLSRQFAARCEKLGLRPADFIAKAAESLLTPNQRPEPAPECNGNLRFLNLNLCLRVGQVLELLAADFGVTRRFIEVRLKKYRLLPQHVTIL